MTEEAPDREELLKQFAEKEETINQKTTTFESQVGPKITEVPNAALPWQKEHRPLGNQIGWIPLPIEDFPTRGLFYPKDTVIAIRAANGGEIRHWSTLQEDNSNPLYLSLLDDMINYVIERCVTIKSSNPQGAFLSWKDIKEVDRFYLLLAIHELTFPEGENKLQVKISDTKKIIVVKDMVSYISLDPKLMRYYDEEERCFVIKKDKVNLMLDIPSVGVTQWIKQHIQRKQRQQENVDEDYVSFAPFIIRSWRGLSDDVYAKYSEASHTWDVKTISILVYIKDLFQDAVNPVIRYHDEGGVEQTAPLNFQGGIKSLFLISDPLGELE